jgi:hypothetical protein
MSAFEATIRVGEASIEAIQSPDGKTYDAHLILGVMAVAPVAPGQALPIPLGIVRVPLDKNALQSLAKEFTETADKLDERSDLAIASDLSSVERIAEQQAGLR